jgi:nitroreductase
MASRTSSGVQKWMQADPTIVWTAALVLATIAFFLVRKIRNAPDYSLSKESTTRCISNKAAAATLPTPKQTLHLIQTRRTITPKDLTGEPVADLELHSLLEAANWAPTHHKTQPWRYVILAGSQAITNYLGFLDTWYTENSHRLSEDTLTKFRRKLDSVILQWPENLSHLIICVMKRQANPEKLLPEWEELSACAMSIQNLHLMATSLQIGVFWSSHTWCRDARDSIDMKEYLGMDERDKVLGALTLGRYDLNREFASTRTPMLDKLQFRLQ